MIQTIQQYVVDAFAKDVFTGNQAAVCVVDEWLPDALMCAIARENNFSETAFVRKTEKGWALRWFTPAREIDLCGHATLASGYTVLNFCEPQADKVVFETMSGLLTVSRRDGRYEIDLPVYTMHEVPVTQAMTDVIGVEPIAAYMGRDLVCVLAHEDDVRNAAPDPKAVLTLEGDLLHITAAGERGYETVTRSFAPKLGVDEDPVCGSGHCHVIPVWSERTGGKTEFKAFQASKRSGELFCRLAGDRLFIAGDVALFAKSDIYVPVH